MILESIFDCRRPILPVWQEMVAPPARLCQITAFAVRFLPNTRGSALLREPVAIASLSSGAIAPHPKTSPPTCRRERMVNPLPADLTLFGKGQRLGGLHPDSPKGESVKSGGSRRHVGELVVRRLSRKSQSSGQSDPTNHVCSPSPKNYGN